MRKSTRLCGVLMGVALGAAYAQNVEASTIYRVVGTCTTSPVVPASRHYARIQDAVDASIASTQAAIILVCPGVYREQVTIAPNLAVADYAPVVTLKGYAPGVVIAPPAGGLVANYHSAIPRFSDGSDPSANSNGWVAAQLLVHDTAGVQVTNIEFDGTGAACPSVAGVPSTVAAVVFANVGDESYNQTAGLVRFVSIHDLAYPFVSGCGYSEGIISENAWMAINDNTIQRVYDTGILEYGANNQILRNTISQVGYTGIRLTAAQPIDVSLNKLSRIEEWGILLENGTNGVTVDKNTTSPELPIGVYVLNSHDNSIVNNTINNAFGGVFLDGGASNNLVEGNIVNGCAFACIMDRASHGGNTIDWNDFHTSSLYGIWLYSADVDNMYSNLFDNTPIPVCHSTVASFDTGHCTEQQ